MNVELLTSADHLVAMEEFRELARAMYEAVPEQFKYLLADCVHKPIQVLNSGVRV